MNIENNISSLLKEKLEPIISDNIYDVNIKTDTFNRFKYYLNKLYKDAVSSNLVLEEYNVNMDDIYVPVSVHYNKGSLDLNRENAAFFIKDQRDIIISDTGMGKTTILRWIAKMLIDNCLKIPVYIKCNDIENKTIYEVIAEAIDISDKVLREIIKSGIFLVLIDDLDVVSYDKKIKIYKELSSFVDLNSKNSFLFSSSVEIEEIKGFRKIEIAPLNDEKVLSLITNCGNFIHRGAANWLIELIKSYKDIIQDYLENPFYLLLLFKCSLYFSQTQGTNWDAFKGLPEEFHPLFKIKKLLERSVIEAAKKKRKESIKTKIISNYNNEKLEFCKPTLKSNQEDYIIQPHGGGLGDFLFYSHLPKIAKESGRYNRVLVSNNMECDNQEFKHLVWELNPYVDGYCNENSGNFGFTASEFEKTNRMKMIFKALDFSNKNQNLLDYLMIISGLDNGKRLQEPELYYQPVNIESLNDKIIYDPYFRSASRVDIKDYFLIDKYFNSNDIEIDYIMRFQNEKNDQKGIFIKNYHSQLSTITVRDFCDVIYSVKGVYGITTGTVSLAASLQKGMNVFVSKIHGCHHSSLHKYIYLT